MGLKEAVEQHPIRHIVSAAVTTCTVTAGIVGFLMNKKAEIDAARLESMVAAVENEKRLVEERHRSEVDWLHRRHADALQKHTQELEAVQKQVATVQRTIGPTSEALDVRQMLVSGRQAGQRFSGSDYFAEERFFARRPTAGDGWSYFVTTELGMLAHTTGMAPEALRGELPPETARLLEAVPLHAWRHREEYRVESGEMALRIAPMIIVQHLPEGGMEKLLQEAAGSSEDTSGQSLEDKSGTMLTQFLLIEAQAREPGKMRTNIGELHKVGDVVYAHIETTLQDVVVNGAPMREFLLIKELLIIGTAGELYVVKTVIPTPPDFSNPGIAWIGDWFLHFGIRTREGGLLDVHRTADRRERG